jgi:hypothetical protein
VAEVPAVVATDVVAPVVDGAAPVVAAPQVLEVKSEVATPETPAIVANAPQAAIVEVPVAAATTAPPVAVVEAAPQVANVEAPPAAVAEAVEADPKKAAA